MKLDSHVPMCERARLLNYFGENRWKIDYEPNWLFVKKRDSNKNSKGKCFNCKKETSNALKFYWLFSHLRMLRLIVSPHGSIELFFMCSQECLQELFDKHEMKILEKLTE